jgi:hypothetical protein
MPSIINATTSTGLVTTADNSGSLQLATNSGTTALTIDTSQNVGIGTASPTGKLEVTGGQLRVTASSASSMFLVNPSTTYANGVDIQATYNGAGSFGPLKFTTSSTERMRIASDGNVAIGTSTPLVGRVTVAYDSNSGAGIIINQTNAGSAGNLMSFRLNNVEVGSIYQNTANTSYITSSDYRLKENIAPMTGALDKVAQLKPCTYTWKADGSDGQGFIAHELQAVVPDAVVGEKDAVDEEGNIKPQGIDTSFLVATLTSAIQELNAKVEAQAVRIAELEGAK